MKRSVRIGAVAFLAFVIILIARFPAKWASGVLPEGISCDQIGGSLWSGTCIGLVTRGVPAGDFSWSLHFSKLFTGKLGGHIAWARGTASAEGDVDYGFSGNIGARDLKAKLPLDPTLLPWVPSNLRGVLNANLNTLRVEGRAIKGIEGQIEGRGLEQNGTAFGDYRLTFPPAQNDGEPVGQLVDLGEGPLRVVGAVKLTGEPGYEVNGRVAANPGAPPMIVQQLQILGSPDAEGMRPFSLAATF